LILAESSFTPIEKEPECLTEDEQPEDETKVQCFYTRESYKRDLVGVGITFLDTGFGNQLALSCHYDLLSAGAWICCDCRYSLWGHRLDTWMPVAIDAEHFEAGLGNLFETLEELCIGSVAQNLITTTRKFGNKSYGRMKSAYAMSDYAKFDDWVNGRSTREMRRRQEQESREFLECLKKEQRPLDEALLSLKIKEQKPAKPASVQKKKEWQSVFTVLALSEEENEEIVDDASESSGVLVSEESSDSGVVVSDISEVLVSNTIVSDNADATSESAVVVSEADDDTWSIVTNPKKQRWQIRHGLIEAPQGAETPREPVIPICRDPVRSVEYNLVSEELPEHFVLYVLHILPKLMNSQLTRMMKGVTHNSEKALEGYIGFHHMFLRLCDRYPIIRREVEAQIYNFKNFDSRRHKEYVPDLGEFFCLLSVSDEFSFQDIVLPLVEETMCRNTRWLLEAYPYLSSLSSEQSLKAVFKSSVVGRRILMFHAWFLQNIATPLKKDDSVPKSVLKLQEYEKTKGAPSLSQINGLQGAVTDILDNVTTWDKFFTRVGLKCNYRGAQLDQFLARQRALSHRRGY